MNNDLIRKILVYMRESGANITPLKTRDIADAMNMDIYRARYYLYKLQFLAFVESDGTGKGRSIRWRLIR